MALKRIVAPTLYPLTLAEAKAHLRVDHDDEDTLIQALIVSATEYVDGPNGFLGRALIDQTWDLVLDKFPTNEVKIPMPPLIEVVQVAYDDPDGNPQIFDPGSYTVDDASEPGWILPDGNWPNTFNGINSVRVRFRAGYVDTSESPPLGEVPGDIKAALLLTIGSLYANRELVVVGQSAVELPWGAHDLLRRKRIDLSMA